MSRKSELDPANYNVDKQIIGLKSNKLASFSCE